MGLIYLLHFKIPYKHARHYLGYTDNLPARLNQHAFNGDGARLLQVVRDAGIEFTLVRVWKGDRSLERQFKKRARRTLCPLCREHGRYRGHYRRLSSMGLKEIWRISCLEVFTKNPSAGRSDSQLREIPAHGGAR